jgi:6-pyruvoyl-tetrahydropterin synthase
LWINLSLDKLKKDHYKGFVMKTDFDTLKQLASHLLSHLQETEIVEFPVDKRIPLIESLATELGVSFSTDEDIKDQAIEEVQEKFGHELADNLTETEMFNHAKKEIIKSFSGEILAGLYLTESLHKVALRVKDFLLDDTDITEVYATDQEIIDHLIHSFKKFTPKVMQQR